MSKLDDWLDSSDFQFLDEVLYPFNSECIDFNNPEDVFCQGCTSSRKEKRSSQVRAVTNNIELTESETEILKLHRLKTSSSIQKVEAETNKDSSDSDQANRLSDAAMFKFAMYEQNFALESQNECKSNCNGNNKGSCCLYINFKEFREVRSDFWGDEPPSRQQRKEKTKSILQKFFCPATKCFVFKIGKTAVCEFAYLRILGLITSASANKPEQWTQVKNEVLGKIVPDVGPTKVATQSKFEHAVVFIKWLAEMFAEPGYVDTSLNSDVATKPNDLVESNAAESRQAIKFLPYEHVTELFAEYENFYRTEEDCLHPTEKMICKITTFREALKSLNSSIRLRSAKGSFETCSVCNNLNDILKNTKLKWSKDQLAIILKIKRLHLQQQAAERQDAKRRKLLAKTSFKGRNPEYAYIEMDAYTEYKCLTPRLWQYRNTKGDTKRMGNRVVGVIVVCGPIETRFVYSLDDLVYGGASTMIEVLRQAFNDLGVLLSELPDGGLLMPKNIFLQFDNCGENKNKYMFAYLSLLNLKTIFNTIQVNFLIVGHTHSPLDQYFSTLSNKLWDTHFVGSPMALQNLFGECENPLVNRQIWVHYDYKAWLEPYLNKQLKYISLPHVFLITSELQLPILQHKPYSTSPDFLPLKPQGANMIVERSKLIEMASSNSLVLEELGLLGGFDTLFKEIIGSSVTKESMIKNRAVRHQSDVLGDLFDKLIEVDSTAAVETQVQMEHECEVGYLSSINESNKALITEVNLERAQQLTVDDTVEDVEKLDRFKPKPEQLKYYQSILSKAGTATTGYVLVFDFSKVTDEWLESSPQVFNYIEQADVIDKLNLVDEEIRIQDAIIANRAAGLVKEQSKRRQRESIFSKIATKVKAAAKMKTDIDNKQYNILTDTWFNVRTGLEEPRPFSFREKALLQREVDFYIQNSTPLGVLQTLDYHVKEARKQPYMLFPKIHFSERQLQDYAKKEAAHQKLTEDMEAKLKYQLGAKYSNAYYNQNGSNTGGVLPHMQPSTRQTNRQQVVSQRTATHCEVLDCNSVKYRKCSAKECGKYICRDHAKHNRHKALQFKAAATTSSGIVTVTPESFEESPTPVVENPTPVVSSSDNPVVTTDVDDISDDSDSESVSPKLCQVMECEEEAVHRCSNLNCLFFAVCELHYRLQHASHEHLFRKQNNTKRTKT